MRTADSIWPGRHAKMGPTMSELYTLFGGGGTSDAGADALREARLSELLANPDRKSRVAAYAYVYANPDVVRVGELTDAVTAEDTPFGQYWGVRALRRQLQADPTALDAAARARLERFATLLAPDTDAADELRQLLSDVPG